MAFENAHGQLPASMHVQTRKERLTHLGRIWVRTFFLAGISVLLGRASIEHVISPFAIAYFTVLTELMGPRRSRLAFAGLIGAYLRGGVGAAASLGIGMLVYLLCRKAFFRKKGPDIHWVPFLAGTIDAAVRLVSIGTVWSQYDIFMSLAEGSLVIILALIFIQCLPVFAGKNPGRSLRPEQLVSLTILVGSMITGLSGLQAGNISVLQVAVDWVVLMLSCAGGVGIGTTTAIVVGVLTMMNHEQTMASVAVLGFAALLAGILKETRRVWVAISFVLSISLLSMTTTSNWEGALSMVSSAGLAGLFFILSPRQLRQEIASYVPGTVEHEESEQERVRRIRKLLSEKIEDMSQVFDELSETFADAGDNQLLSAQQLLDHTVGRAAKTVCTGCPRKSLCWDKEGFATYQAIVNTVAKLESNTSHFVQPTKDLKERCIRIDPMMGVLRHSLDVTDRDAQWIAKLREQRTLVSAQLSGVANVIRTVSEELDRETESRLAGEEQILAALEQLGLYVDQVHIVSLDPGKVEVEVLQPSQGAYENSVRMIAPLLSGIVGENISVSRLTESDGGPCTSVFTSARLFNVDTAVATVARDGRMVSGDTYTSIDLGNGRHAVAVSDGMGNGECARRESKAAIELLKKLMTAGFDEQLAIKTVNSTLLLRSKDEMFTTLDMAVIDLYSAKAEFLKIGSAPSFLKRGKEVHAISGANVPIGILQDIEVQSIDEQLRSGDILILMSDGIYDAPQHVYDKEEWVKRQIERLETNHPQEIADTLLEAAVRMNHGQIHDDMTVVVAVLSAHQPEWASIKLPGVTGLRKGGGKKRGA